MTNNILPIQLSPKFPHGDANFLCNKESARSASVCNPQLFPLQTNLEKLSCAGPTYRYYWSKGLAHEKLLGSGYTASVYKGYDAEIGDSIAIKYISKTNQRLLATDNYFRTLYRRIKSFNHRNLLKIRDFYESEDSFYVISDLCTGPDLVDFILQFKPRTLPAVCIKYIMFQILSALNFMHSRRVIHRDIKLDNILFTDHTYKEIKIVDFDMAMMLNHSELPRAPRTPEEIFVVGTKDYMAPENYHGEYSEASDLWSVGVMMYIFFDGHFPFDLSNSNRHNRESLAKGINLIPELRTKHPLATDLLLKLLSFDIKNRIRTTKEALSHPWFREQIKLTDSFNGALSFYANKANTYQKSLQHHKQHKQQQRKQEQQRRETIQITNTDNCKDCTIQHKAYLSKPLHISRQNIISSTPLPSNTFNNKLYSNQQQKPMAMFYPKTVVNSRNIPELNININKNNYNDVNNIVSSLPVSLLSPSEENKTLGFKWHPTNIHKFPPAEKPAILNPSNSTLSNNSTIASSREFRERIKRYLSTKNDFAKTRWLSINKFF